MTHRDLTEYKLYELDRTIDDLSSLSHEEGCADLIWPRLELAERRLKDLRIDCQSLQVAAE
jgi:hypothetical protein